MTRREMEGYVPFKFSLCPSLLKKFEGMTGPRDYANYYDMPMRFIGVDGLPRDVDCSGYFKGKGENIVINHWGVGNIKGSLEHFSRMIHPMEDFKTIKDFENFPYPNAEEDYDWKTFSHKVKGTKDRDLISVASMDMTIFEIAWYLRGIYLYDRPYNRT
ncbi:MAG TPA: hypothetical protein VFD57_01060 [Clostridia bacterium]|nr:hypothetical protein [Clostridia bacterium]